MKRNLLKRLTSLHLFLWVELLQTNGFVEQTFVRGLQGFRPIEQFVAGNCVVVVTAEGELQPYSIKHTMSMDYKKWSDAIDKRVEQKKHEYKGPHCCLTMDAELAKGDALLYYSPRFREYGVTIPKSTGSMLMDYCMFCGKKLPTSVRDEWFDILEKEYELEQPDSKDKKKVPQEFWTDQWWKKRRL